MKIRAGGGALGQQGGTLGQQGAPPCYSSLWETLFIFLALVKLTGKVNSDHLDLHDHA